MRKIALSVVLATLLPLGTANADTMINRGGATSVLAPAGAVTTTEHWVRRCYYSGTAGSTPQYCVRRWH